MKKYSFIAIAASALTLAGCTTMSEGISTIIHGSRGEVEQATATALKVPVSNVAFVSHYAGDSRNRTWQAELTNGRAYTCFSRPTIDSPFSNAWCQAFAPTALR